MRLSAPTKSIFWISVLLAVIALINQYRTIPLLSPFAFWILFGAYFLLFLGSVFKGI